MPWRKILSGRNSITAFEDVDVVIFADGNS